MSLRAIDIHHHYVPQVLLDEVKRHGNSLDVVISQTSDGHTSLSFAGGEKYQIQPDLPEIDRRLSVMDEGKIAIAVLEAHTASLGYRLRYELVQRVCKQVAGRVPVLVGITDTAFVESVRLAGHAADAGAQAVVLSSPYYHTVAQPELWEYLQHIVPELPLPVFLYNMPSLTKVPFALDTLRRAMDLPQVVGIKDSSGDMGYFHQVGRLLAERPEWSLLIGPEDLLADAVLLAGAHGGVNGGANLAPRLYVELYEAAVRYEPPSDRFASLSSSG